LDVGRFVNTRRLYEVLKILRDVASVLILEKSDVVLYRLVEFDHAKKLPRAAALVSAEAVNGIRVV
jgi:hypothetical protein